MEIKLRFTETQPPQSWRSLSRASRCAPRDYDTAKAGRLRARSGGDPRQTADLARADKIRLPFVHVQVGDRPGEQTALRVLEETPAISCAGALHEILSPNFVWRYKNKIIKSIPPCCPVYGPQPYRQAYEQGVNIIGVSAHFSPWIWIRDDHCAKLFPCETGMTLAQNRGDRASARSAHAAKSRETLSHKRLDVYWGVV
jgi:formyltetrahydrofolate deformylase